jgi:hypothetical protein
MDMVEEFTPLRLLGWPASWKDFPWLGAIGPSKKRETGASLTRFASFSGSN